MSTQLAETSHEVALCREGLSKKDFNLSANCVLEAPAEGTSGRTQLGS